MATVAIVKQSKADYSARAPYDPPEIFPETPFVNKTDETNEVYASVRELFHLLGYDARKFGSPDWNPLGWLIKPGETVFLKPNMIAEKHYYSDDWEYVITHGSVIRAVADYVFIALRGKGKIVIGDSPTTEADFDKLVERMGLAEIRSLYQSEKDFEVELIDLRDEQWIEKDRVVVDTKKLAGDPLGGLSVDLAENSAFAELDGNDIRYYGAFYDIDETNEHHRPGKHEYAISRSPIAADVFISLPKVKTHKKCGMTLNLKGLVGINAKKNWLPHYIFGSPENGGDQFDRAGAKSSLENTLVRKMKQILLTKNPIAQLIARKTKKLAYLLFGHTEEVIRSGNWHGNNTVWRMALDLNRILMYANADGTMRDAPNARRYFSVADGIIAMEGNGPVAGVPKPTGFLIAGDNAVAVDTICARLMGLDLKKLPMISRAYDGHAFPLFDGTPDDIEPVSNCNVWNRPVSEWRHDDIFHFEPHFAWKGWVELRD